MKTKFKLSKRFLSILLAIVMVVGMLPFSALTVYAAAGPSTTVTIDGLAYTFTLTRFMLKGVDFLNTTSNLQVNSRKNGTTIEFGVKCNYITANGQNVTYDGFDSDLYIFSFSDTNCSGTINVSLDNGMSGKQNYATVAVKRAVASHTGGTSCSSPKCTRCGTSYIDHNYSYKSDATHHWLVCANNASHITAKEPHTGGNPTCTTSAACTTCRADYTLDHVFDTSVWKWDNDKHYNPCTTAGCTARGNESGCSYSELECTQDKKCSVCQHIAQEAMGHNYNYAVKTGTTNVLEETCTRCDHSAEATLTTTQSEYTFNPVQNGITGRATVTFSDNWMGSKEYYCFHEDYTEVGTVTVRAEIRFEGAPYEKEITCNYEVKPADISNSFVQAYPDVYNGNALQVDVFYRETASGLGSKLEDTDYIIEWNTDEQVDAGSYVITVTGKGNYTGSFEQNIIVNAANLRDVAVAQTGALTYNDGEVLDLIGNISATATAVNNQSITFTYCKIEDGTYGTLPDLTEAGTYTIYYKASAPNHNDAMDRFTVIVNKADVDYTAPTAKELAYDSNPQDLVATGTATGGVMWYALGTDASTAPANGWSVEVPQGKDAGTYYVWYKVIGDSNHNDVAPSCVEVEINKATQNAPAAGKIDESISAKNDGAITNVDSTMEYRKDGEDTYTAITETEVTGLADGAYYVRYKETGNYIASPETEITIAAGRKLTVTVPQNQVGYELTTTTPEMDWYGTLNVEFKLLDGYSMLDGFEIYDGNEPMWQHFNHETGILQLNFVGSDFDFRVEGVADVTAPAAEIQLAENTWNQFLNDVTFGMFFNKTQDVTIIADDKGSGLDAIYYYLSGRELELDEVKTIDNWQEYNGTFQINPENKYVIYAKAVDKDGNTTYINSDGVILDSIVPVISGIENNATYYTTQKVSVTDDNLKTVIVNENEVTGEIVLEGDTDATYTIVATDEAGNTTTVTVTMKPIKELAKATEHLTHDNVTSEDAPALEDLVAKLDELIADPDTSDDGEKETLQQHKAIAEGLLKTIDEAAKATDTENTEKVQDVTAENVTTEDKTDLEKAKDDLEKALEDNSGNYTDDEKKAIEDEIERINDALEIIKNVEEVESLINKIPENITKKDEAAIKEAEKAYNALTDYEKSLVDQNVKKALDDAKADLEKVKKPAETAESTSPSTGDNSNLWMWFALLFVSGGVMAGINVYGRKKKDRVR